MTASLQLAEAEARIVWSKTDEDDSWVLRADYGSEESPKAYLIKIAKSFGEDGLKFARQALIEDVASAL